MPRRVPLFLSCALFLLGGNAVAQQPPAEKPGAADEQLLQQAKIATDDDSLFRYLDNHSLKEGDHEALLKLVEQLAAPNLQARKKAQADLVQRGPLAIPYLKKAQKT